ANNCELEGECTNPAHNRQTSDGHAIEPQKVIAEVVCGGSPLHSTLAFDPLDIMVDELVPVPLGNRANPTWRRRPPRPQGPCPGCGSKETKVGLGTETHHGRLLCGKCERFLRWLPKPREETVGNGVGASDS